MTEIKTFKNPLFGEVMTEKLPEGQVGVVLMWQRLWAIVHQKMLLQIMLMKKIKPLHRFSALVLTTKLMS